MKENQILWIGEALLVILIAIGATAVAIRNVIRGQVHHPMAFLIVIAGLILFMIAKISVIRKQGAFIFGTNSMSQMMANLNRIGYWLIFVGFLFTFV